MPCLLTKMEKTDIETNKRWLKSDSVYLAGDTMKVYRRRRVKRAKGKAGNQGRGRHVLRVGR